MQAIGFREETRYFRHPDSPHVIEFPPGPLAIGGHPVGRVEEMRLATGRLRIISPTDCVKDRLAAYFHWGDLQSLHQALQVARRRKVNLQEVRTWSRAEGTLRELEAFAAGLKAETDEPIRTNEAPFIPRALRPPFRVGTMALICGTK